MTRKEELEILIKELKFQFSLKVREMDHYSKTGDLSYISTVRVMADSIYAYTQEYNTLI